MANGLRIVLIHILDQQIQVAPANSTLSLPNQIGQLLMAQKADHLTPVPLLDIVPRYVLNVLHKCVSPLADSIVLGLPCLVHFLI